MLGYMNAKSEAMLVAELEYKTKKSQNDIFYNELLLSFPWAARVFLPEGANYTAPVPYPCIRKSEPWKQPITGIVYETCAVALTAAKK